MKLLLFFTLVLSSTLSAQWKSVTYQLKGGWNAIYLHGDATHVTLDTLFSAGDALNVEEVWRWNPNPSQVQFTTDPFVPSPGTPEWSTWFRTPPGGVPGTLTSLSGQSAYLVKCSGNASTTHTVDILQKVLPPQASWVRNGANLLGFPASTSPAPSFSNYFATFPAAIAANSKIFKYTGGPLGPANPLQIFSPLVEPLDRNRAYWFEAKVSGSFYAPLEVTTNTANGISFGRTGSVVSLQIRNRSEAAVTITLTPGASANAPGGEVVSPVPLTLRTFNSGTGLYDETLITGAITQVIGPEASVVIGLGIDRSTMNDPSALYASFLTLTDSSGLMELDLPVSAEVASLAGLWFGTVLVDEVQATPLSIGAVALINEGEVTAVELTSSGGRGYDVAPTVTIDSPVAGSAATATAIVEGGVVTGFDVTDGGSGYEKPPGVTVSSPPLTGSSVIRPFPLRYFLHIDDTGVGRILSQVFVGVIDSTGEWGVCTDESLLQQSSKGSARRFVAAHLPLDQVIPAGSIGLGTNATFNVISAFNSPTSPFVHRFHPDHDNKSPRGEPLSEGQESYTTARAVTFTFAPTPPSGVSATGWGASLLAGDYSEVIGGTSEVIGGISEVIGGIYRGSQTLSVAGSFQFRRINEIGAIFSN